MSGWSIPIERIAERAGLQLDTVARKVTFDLFRSVVEKSPVDTGRFKGNWNVSRVTPNFTVSDAANAARGDAEARKALSLAAGSVVYLSNGLPYARRLEYGWSGQAPVGMVRLSVREFGAFVQRALP